VARRIDIRVLATATQVAARVVIGMCYAVGARAEQRPAISATLAAAEESVSLAMLEARFDGTSEWLLSVAGVFVDPGPAPDETQLRLSAIGTLSVGGWTYENRHLFSFSSASVERYRMRVRAVRPGLFDKRKLSARAFDEVFFDFDSRRLFRNNFALGIGVQMSDAWSGELYQVWETNRSRGDNAYILALMTVRFGANHTNL
jgi:hypothetical protein